MAVRDYYAHTTLSGDKSTWQPLKSHLVNVAELASTFASDFNGKEFAYASGILHDIGKYSCEFQSLLNGARIKVDHSTAGAIESRRNYPVLQSRVLEYIVAGHHAGLMNYGSYESGLESRLNGRKLPDYSDYIKEIVLPDLSCVNPRISLGNNSVGFSISFFIRMLFSCLVDADSLDTEQFCNPEKALSRGVYDDMESLAKKFDQYMALKKTTSSGDKINQYRNEIFNQCLRKGSEQPRLFSLTVPTGGGKTLSSMAFALEQVKRYGLKRIIYVIPFTNIIEQTAAIFKGIFGEKNVLEHHSNFDPWISEDEGADEGYDSLKLSTENWDAPIIVTTNVQFFESLFSNRRSRCRKIHNIARSVIIFDEAQMLPTQYLLPCLATVTELVRNYGSSVVMCTATQPKFGDLLRVEDRPIEIIESPKKLYEAFKRVTVKNLGVLDDKELSKYLRHEDKVLCIVNTRNHAKVIFDSLSDLDNVFHLSARMCPVHRRQILDRIKKKLSEEGESCRVISTQLIEAGVDIDFPTVYRAMAGIDSIAQAAGRCNREGRLQSGEVKIFLSSEKHGRSTSWQKRTAELGEMVLEDGDEPLSLENVENYFHLLYYHEGEEGLDKKGILKLLKGGAEGNRKLEFPFEDVSDSFSLIDKGTKEIVIPYDDNVRSIIEEMKISRYPWKFLRKLQGYTVSIFDAEFKELTAVGSIDTIDCRFFILNDMKKYSPNTGLLNSKYNGLEDTLLLV
jgi:CRISPR-associated helicase Cas3/CRISPR-associated endonuclease Cas3-HD